MRTRNSFKSILVFCLLCSSFMSISLAQVPANPDSGIYLSIGGGGNFLNYNNSDFQQAVNQEFATDSGLIWNDTSQKYQDFVGYGGLGYQFSPWFQTEIGAYTPVTTNFAGYFTDNLPHNYKSTFTEKLYAYNLLATISGKVGQTSFKPFLTGGVMYEILDTNYIENDRTTGNTGYATAKQRGFLPAAGFGLGYTINQISGLSIQTRLLYVVGKNERENTTTQYPINTYPITISSRIPSNTILTLGLQYLF